MQRVGPLVGLGNPSEFKFAARRRLVGFQNWPVAAAARVTLLFSAVPDTAWRLL